LLPRRSAGGVAMMYFLVYSCCVASKFYGGDSNNLRTSISGVHRSLAKQDKVY